MNVAIIFAGGVGRRMKNDDNTPKQFLKINNKPIIIHTLEHFEKCADIDFIVISCVEKWIEYLKKAIKEYNLNKVMSIVKGGETGQLSIFYGLEEAFVLLSKINGYKSLDESNDIVLIHDGVRPLINQEIIKNNIKSVKEFGSAITTVPVNETILVVDEKDNSILEVPDRDKSRLARAPQSFYLKDILKIHREKKIDNKINTIDSCTMMERAGFKLHLVDGPIENIKITTPQDLFTMNSIIDYNNSIGKCII